MPMDRLTIGSRCRSLEPCSTKCSLKPGVPSVLGSLKACSTACCANRCVGWALRSVLKAARGCSLRLRLRRSQSSRRPGRPGRLSQNRTCAVHIRLFGTMNCDPHRRPAYDLALFQSSESCTGAMTCSTSSPTWSSLLCSSPSAPRTVQGRVGSPPLRRRPLGKTPSGFRLSRSSIQAPTSVVRPASPSIPAGASIPRLDSAFAEQFESARCWRSRASAVSRSTRYRRWRRRRSKLRAPTCRALFAAGQRRRRPQ